MLEDIYRYVGVKLAKNVTFSFVTKVPAKHASFLLLYKMPNNITEFDNKINKNNNFLTALNPGDPGELLPEKKHSSIHNPVLHGMFNYFVASRYAIQHILCLSQAWINWEGGSKGIQCKTGEWWRLRHRWSGSGGIQPDCWRTCLYYLPHAS